MVALAQQRRQSVQELPDAQQNTANVLDYWLSQRGWLLDAWGSRSREIQLRNIYRHDYNWMVQGAFAGIMKVIASTPWEISGPDDLSSAQSKYYQHAHKQAGFGETESERPDVDYWQAVLRGADFGRGWGSFIMKGVDYLRQDAGWYWEIIAPGNPMKPPTGPATGLAYLDSLRCLPTGDPEFPVIYVDKNGMLHQLHQTRVVQLMDMPDGDERRPGYGYSALSRAVSISYREILMGRYIEALLDDQPAPGIISATGLTKEKRDLALRLYQEDQRRDERPPWGKQLWLYGLDRDAKVEIDLFSFQQAPEKFDFKTYTELDVDALALAIGVDRQDLWQLTGGGIGTGTQSKVLDQKSRGKTIGMLRTSIERAINDILPDEYEFTFKYRDSQEDQERAQTAGTWASAVAAAREDLSMDERRRVLANVVEPFGDVLRDDSGEVTQRDDLDVLAEGQEGDVTRNETEGSGPSTDGTGSDSTGGEQPEPETHVGRRQHADPVRDTTDKQFQATRLNFEIEWADLIEAAKAGDMPRQRFRVVARALLRRHGLDAYKDGLKDGGVDTDALEDDDQTQFALWLADQNPYISAIERRLYVDERAENAEASAEMWANKSLQTAYYDGLQSAAANGMFEFAGEDGVESCTTCQRLKGQRHRLKTWTRKQLRPGVDTQNYECKGFFCNHVLVRTDQPAYGRF